MRYTALILLFIILSFSTAAQTVGWRKNFQYTEAYGHKSDSLLIPPKILTDPSLIEDGAIRVNPLSGRLQLRRIGVWNDVTEDANLGYINVEWFGAKGDSITDCTVAIQAAITAAPIGGTVFIPAGKYLISGGITINKQLIIKGSGGPFNATTQPFVPMPAGTSIFVTNGTANGFIVDTNAVRFQDFELICNATNPSSSGILFNRGSYSRLLDVGVKNFNININFQNGGNWKMDGVLLYGPVTENLRIRYVLAPDGGDQMVINTVFNTGTYDSITHINYISGGGLKIMNCKFNQGGSSLIAYKARNCIVLNNTDGNTVDFQISNCSLENFYRTAIDLKPQFAFANIVINGNQINPNILADTLIRVAGVGNVMISNNVMANARVGISYSAGFNVQIAPNSFTAVTTPYLNVNGTTFANNIFPGLINSTANVGYRSSVSGSGSAWEWGGASDGNMQFNLGGVRSVMLLSKDTIASSRFYGPLLIRSGGTSTLTLLGRNQSDSLSLIDFWGFNQGLNTGRISSSTTAMEFSHISAIHVNNNTGTAIDVNNTTRPIRLNYSTRSLDTLQSDKGYFVSTTYAEEPTRLWQSGGNGFLDLGAHSSTTARFGVRLRVADNIGHMRWQMAPVTTGGTLAYVDKMELSNDGNLTVGGIGGTSRVDVIGSAGYNQFRLRTTYTPTSSADTNGNIGDMSWDANYIYIKTAAGWKRSTLTTF